MDDTENEITENEFSQKDALHIKLAELWLMAREPKAALAELDELPEKIRQESWPASLLARALVALKRTSDRN
jgi:hypothetical protein